jgi:dihydroneopterin aldolase
MLIKINNLRLTTNQIGVYDWEKTVQRPIIINAVISSDCEDSTFSDDLSDTIDYDKIFKKIAAVAAKKHFKLIEKMAKEMIDAVMEDSRISACELSVEKVGVVENVDSFAVTLTQKRP